MFEYNGKTYTLEQLQNVARQKGYTFDELLNKNPNINELGKTTPTSTGADVEETAAPGMDSKSANLFLDLQEISNEQKRKLPYNVSQKLLREKKPFTKKNITDLGFLFEEPKKKDITFSESVSNSLSNTVERIKQIAPKVNLTSGIIFKKIFGDENVNKFVEFAGEDTFWTEGLSEKDRIEAIEKIQESQAKSKETGEIIQGFKEGDLSDIAGGMFNALTSLVPSIIEGGAGFLLGGKVGAGLMIGTDFFGESYISVNEEKAKRLNVPLEELINNDQDEVIAPLVFSALMTASEGIGLGAIASGVKGKITGAGIKKLSNFLFAGAAESGTEIIQTALEKAQQEYGKTNNIGKTRDRFAEAFSEQDTWEAGIQGFIGGAGFSGGGNKDVRKAIASARVSEDIKSIESDVEQIADLNYKLRNSKDKTVQVGIRNKITEINNKLSNRIIQTNSVFNFASNKNIDDINNLDDLAKLQVNRFKELKKKRDENKISDEDYAIATEGYKAEYLRAKERIQGIKKTITNNANKTAKEAQNLYEQKGKEATAEIVELYRPMAEKLAMKRRNVPGFDKQLLTDEILTGKRGILDLINEYDPDANPGITLPMYVNKFAAQRAIEASKRILKTEFETDVTEAKGVTDTTTETQTQEQTKQEVKTALAKDLNLSEETQNEIVAAVEKTLGTKLPAVTDKAFKSKLTEGFRTELTNTLKKVFGKTAAYEQFLRDNFEKIYPAIPQETINRRFKEFNERITDEAGKQLRERTAEGKKVFKKKEISKAEFLKYFLNAKGSTKGVRKTALAEVIANEVGLDNVLDALAKPEVVQRFKAIQELQGQEVPSNFIEIISEKIDRAINYLDNLQKNNDTLYASLLIPEISIATLKTFLKAAKAAIKAGQTFAQAIKIGIKAASGSTLTETTKADIVNKLKPYNVASVSPQIVDPEVTSVLLTSTVKYSSASTTKSTDTLKSEITTAVTNYNTNTLQKFDAVYRHSKLTGLIDDVDTSILSNITTIKIRKSFTPTISSSTKYDIFFRNSLFNPHTGHNATAGGILSSTGFKVTGSDLEQFLDDDGNGNVRRYYLSSGIRTYANETQGTIDYSTGQITLNSLNIASISNIRGSASTIIEITVQPSSNDVVPVRDQIVEIDVANSIVTVEGDTFVGGSAEAGVGYTTTSSY